MSLAEVQNPFELFNESVSFSLIFSLIKDFKSLSFKIKSITDAFKLLSFTHSNSLVLSQKNSAR
ncbi:hypothetical protein SDC9_159391 [bioreactor metagenome]|uniref:Uncharacterized protein n=1 Tax=bioreactor metagenome TaxID=1076179 RepID=A0A645FCM6_9ZZZZ